MSKPKIKVFHINWNEEMAEEALQLLLMHFLSTARKLQGKPVLTGKQEQEREDRLLM